MRTARMPVSLSRALILPMAFLLLLAGCSKRSDRSAHTVITTFLPVQVMALDLTNGLDDIEVISLAPSSAGCPHNYSITPSDLTTLRSADVVVTHGWGLDTWIDTHLPSLEQSGVPVVQLTDTLSELLPEFAGREQHMGEHESEAHDHSGLPHTWTSPDLAATEVRYLAGRLAEVFPQQADSILSRGKKLATRLDSLDEEYKQLGARHAGEEVALFHDSFRLMLERIGVGVALVLQNDPDIPPGPRRTSELIKQLKGDQISALISEPQINVHFARMIQEGSGRNIVALNSLVTGDAEPDLLVTTLAGNLDELQTALEEQR